MIKELLLKADLIIVSAPVYVNHVSGELKVFIDRIGYWTHLFRLAGKLCVNVITSSNSGIKEVKKYLEQLEYFLNYQKAVQSGKCSEAEYEYWQRTGLIHRQSLL